MESALREHLPDGRFNVTPERSRAMGAVRGKDNKTTERRLRFALVRVGIRGWHLHPKDIEGKPDFFFPQGRLAVFVDGCFWHGCPMCGHIPKQNNKFWSAKIERNRARDKEKTDTLRKNGFRVIRFWEHDLAESLGECVSKIAEALAVPPP